MKHKIFSVENGHGQKCSLFSGDMFVASTVAVYRHRANSACTEGFAAPLPEYCFPHRHSRSAFASRKDPVSLIILCTFTNVSLLNSSSCSVNTERGFETHPKTLVTL